MSRTDRERLAEDGMCPNCLTPWKCNGPHDETLPWTGHEPTSQQGGDGADWAPDAPEFREMLAEETELLAEREEEIHNTLSIHVDIDEAATDAEAHAFCDDLVEWIWHWMESHPRRGKWDPFVYSHKGSCEESDHCAGTGSLMEREILKRAGLIKRAGPSATENL